MSMASGSDTKEVFLATVYDGVSEGTLGGTIEWINLYFDIVSAEYYMGMISEEDSDTDSPLIEFSFHGKYMDQHGNELTQYFGEDELFELYQIKIISWEIAEPLDYQVRKS